MLNTVCEITDENEKRCATNSFCQLISTLLSVVMWGLPLD